MDWQQNDSIISFEETLLEQTKNWDDRTVAKTFW